MESSTIVLEPVLEAKARVLEDDICTRIHQPETHRSSTNLDDADDDCVICYLKLHRPARTNCGHTACENCLLHWSLSAMDLKATKDIPSNLGLSIDGIKFKCPTCRTYTSAFFDADRDSVLRIRYPDEYAERDIKATEEANDEDAVQTMVLMYGNSHRDMDTEIDEDSGLKLKHEFTFFVQSSRPDLIEKVEVVLHPGYRQDRLVTLTQPPFSTTHKAWGYFTVFAGVTLTEGWEWVDEALAVDSDATKGRCKDRLPLRWPLQLEGEGGQQTRFAKMRKVKGKDKTDSDVEEEDLESLAAFMSEKEIETLRQTRMAKKRALREG